MKQTRDRTIWIIVALLCITCCLSTVTTAVPQQKHVLASTQRLEPDLQVVRIKAETPERRQQLVRLGIDLLEMRHGDYLFALLTKKQQQQIAEAGWELSVDTQQTKLLDQRAPQLAETGFPAGYRTVEETQQFLADLTTAYPQLTRLIDYGDSWEKVHSDGTKGHDLFALDITNHATPGPKPVFFLMAAIHARELTTSELVTRYSSYLLSNYGSDPDVTWMLNEYEVVVVPIANPDGRVIAEQGKLQRKNTNPGTTICGASDPFYYANQPGVDLNRNASFAWGTVDTPFLSPCEQTYPGTAAASEPEEVALETLLRGLFPDQRGPDNQDAAPENTSGVLISLHSYGNLVLWPWGSSRERAPNNTSLARLGQHFARFNGYAPQQSYDLYPTSGTTDDWLYGERGIASFTFEVGSDNGQVCSGFFPPAACLDGQQGGNFWPQNLPAFLYATRIARAPYTQPAGPDVRSINVVSDTEHITVTATLVNSTGDQQAINDAELYVAQSPWHGGVAVPMRPTDNTFDSTSETVAAVLSATSIPTHTLLLLRGHTGETWGPLWATWNTPTSQVSRTYHVWFPIAGRSQ